MTKKYNLGLGLQFVNWLMKQAPRWDEIPLEKARDNHIEFFMLGFGGQVKLHEVINREIPARDVELGVRIYRPTAASGLPVVVFYHGGGWTIGSLDSHDHICRTVAKKAQVVVISVGYRLAPEHPYPTAVEDAYDALVWSAEHAADYGGDAQQLFVMGDSAGGNLAAVVSLLARDNDGPAIAGQVLIYPAVDAANEYPSRVHFDDAPILSKPVIDFFIAQYVPDEAVRREPLMSPMCADTHQHLPPALVQVAEYDPLIDEGVAYAKQLEMNDVEVTLVNYPRMIHGFYSVGAFASETKRAYDDIVHFIHQNS